MTQYSIRAQFPRKKPISPFIRARILDRDAHLCFYCQYEAAEVDHIIPYTYGGTDDDENLVACCDICNHIASNKIFETLDAKRAFVRARYGPYLQERARRIRRRLSVCPDCDRVFQPRVAGATAILCGPCNRRDLAKPGGPRPIRSRRRKRGITVDQSGIGDEKGEEA